LHSISQADGTLFPVGLLPSTATIGDQGLEVGGVPVAPLAAEFGTPLLIYDEVHLRERCQQARAAFPDGVSYASKAFLCRSLARLIHEEGLGLDVASGGELAVALAAGVPASSLTLHGNNKSTSELKAALDAGVGRIVIDSCDEVDRLEALTAGATNWQRVLLRVNPAVTADTHKSMLTGHAASKFGVALSGGRADEIAGRLRSARHLRLEGIHVHTGSQILDLEPLGRSISAAAAFATFCDAAELIVGGGLGVAYTQGLQAPSLAEWGAVAHAAARAGRFDGRLHAEPGRAIVAVAAITVYTIGTVKTLSEDVILLAVDGGISDNPRPALYGSVYQPLLARYPYVRDGNQGGPFTVVGKNCESSDTFARDVQVLAQPRIGDSLCLPVTGAYSYAMSSNYNGLSRPAVVLVGHGEARMIIRRESFDDLIRTDLFPGPERMS
jgi:diaminopimelate decarboxylase